jgi:hypothetical protein
MVVATRGTPKKETDGGSRQYTRWNNDQKTWLAEWMNDNREEYCNSKKSRPQKARLAFDDLVNEPTLFPKYAEMDFGHVKTQIIKLEDDYQAAKKRLNNSGEGLTKAEARKYDNLQGDSAVHSF